MKTPHMISRGHTPIKTYTINDTYILGVYQGKLSEYDILLKYRQKDIEGNWSRIRTPKHIHWAVDVLIKMSEDEMQTKDFLSFLINFWDSKVKPLNSKQEQDFLLNDKLLQDISKESINYNQIATKGEYSIKFLLLIAKLLMYQEKTNYNKAYMFRNLLDALIKGEDIFKIVSIATHR
jgi:hypothetical protein